MTINRDDWTPKEREMEARMNESERKMLWEIYGSKGRRRAGDLNHYILNENNVCVVVPLGTWAVWFERENKKPNAGRRRVGLDEWNDAKYGRVAVSTVFLGLDHSFGEGARLLFETMVFWGWSNETRYREQWQDRYPTYETAKAGHARAVYLTKKYLAGEITRDEFDA